MAARLLTPGLVFILGCPAGDNAETGRAPAPPIMDRVPASGATAAATGVASTPTLSTAATAPNASKPVPTVMPSGSEHRTPTPVPDGLTEIDVRVHGLELELRYARSDNFTGSPAPGYEAERLWLHPDAAQGLARAHQAALAAGYGLRVYDAYRPQRATEHFVAFARARGHADWLRDGYLSPRSAHSRGLAIDLTLVDLETGLPLEMGCPFDTFSELAHFENASGEATANRRRLRGLMSAAGFVPYSKEWWHFAWTHDEAPILDEVIRP